MSLADRTTVHKKKKIEKTVWQLRLGQASENTARKLMKQSDLMGQKRVTQKISNVSLAHRVHKPVTHRKGFSYQLARKGKA